MIETPKHSVAELYDPAMKITDPDEARDYVESLTRYISEEEGLSEEEAREVAVENIGYYAGLIDLETRERVEKIFNAYHPNLGPL